MRTVTLRVVTDPDSGGRPVIRRQDDSQVGPLFFSFGHLNLLCGACTFLLIRGARTVESIYDALVVCPNCGSLNEAGELEEVGP